MAAFSSRTFTSCRALIIAAETTKFQIVIRPTDIAKWSIRVDTRGLSGRQDDRSTYQRNPSSIVNSLSYKQRTKKVTNAIVMTANWKKDMEIKDDKICQGIRRKPYGLSDDEKWKDEKLEEIRYYNVIAGHYNILHKLHALFCFYHFLLAANICSNDIGTLICIVLSIAML